MPAITAVYSMTTTLADSILAAVLNTDHRRGWPGKISKLAHLRGPRGRGRAGIHGTGGALSPARGRITPM